MNCPTLAQRLSQTACELVRRRHTGQGGSPAQFPADSDSAYLAAARAFPAMLHFNGAAVALEMLRRRSGEGWNEAVPAYLADVAALRERMSDSSPLDSWLQTLRHKPQLPAGNALSEIARHSELDDYLMLQHRLALATGWLKHYADLFCPRREKMSGDPSAQEGRQ